MTSSTSVSTELNLNWQSTRYLCRRIRAAAVRKRGVGVPQQTTGLLCRACRLLDWSVATVACMVYCMPYRRRTSHGWQPLQSLLHGCPIIGRLATHCCVPYSWQSTACSITSLPVRSCSAAVPTCYSRCSRGSQFFTVGSHWHYLLKAYTLR